MIKNRSRKKESCRHCIQWNRSHHFNYCCHHLRFGNLFDHFKRSFSKTTTNKQSVLVSCGLDRLTYKLKQHTGQKKTISIGKITDYVSEKGKRQSNNNQTIQYVSIWSLYIYIHTHTKLYDCLDNESTQ